MQGKIGQERDHAKEEIRTRNGSQRPTKPLIEKKRLRWDWENAQKTLDQRQIIRSATLQKLGTRKTPGHTDGTVSYLDSDHNELRQCHQIEAFTRPHQARDTPVQCRDVYEQCQR